jgi:anthranilate synthase/aminodeoxychorismate synthase-like glutamine amidotransferase
MKVLLIDNYDSFTYNLVQLIGEFSVDINVVRNDKATVDDIADMKADKIVISPGPGRPEDSKVSLDVIRELGRETPVLGVCLGHQAIGTVYGSRVTNAKSLMHGKTSLITHNSKSIYKDIPQKFVGARYHSLVIDASTLSGELEVTATTDEDVIMGIQHKKYPIAGIQFHPESILTIEGYKIIKNWLAL